MYSSIIEKIATNSSGPTVTIDHMTDGMAEELANVLSANTSVVTLNISSISKTLTEFGIIKLAEAIAANTGLQTLEFKYNNLTIPAAKDLCAAVEKNPRIKALHLMEVGLYPDVINEFSDLLKSNRSLEMLELNCMQLEDNNIIPLAQALAFNRGLKNLIVSVNNLGDVSLKEFSNSLKINTSLMELNLRANEIGNEGAIYLAEALALNTTLKVLNLENNYISDEGIIALATMLKNNNTLSHLSLGLNRINEKAFHALLDALSTNVGLYYLNLQKTDIDTERAVLLFNTLKSNTTLSHLNLKQNNIEISIREAILDMMQTNFQLGTLEITGKRPGDYLDISKQLSKNKLYHEYQKKGLTLSQPPPNCIQHGPNCGFYAADTAASFHRIKEPTLFKQAPLPARKKDRSPKAANSLRQLRQALEIPGKGAILSATKLQQVIDKTECKSVIYEIENYEQFLDTIQSNLAKDLPIIIPFPVDNATGNPHPQFLADKAHWATIIGISNDKKQILMAQWGSYNEVDAGELFNAFYNIGLVTTKKYYVKSIQETGNEWEISTTLPKNSPHVEEIPITDLSDFRRRLIVVLPPDYDLDLKPAQTTNNP